MGLALRPQYEMTESSTLFVFLKYPAPGKVKTRVAVELGTKAAANLYRDWIGIVLRNIQPVRPTIRIVGYFDGGTVEQFAEWFPLVDDWLPQSSGDLGERLAYAFAWGHARGLQQTGHPVEEYWWYDPEVSPEP